jgi:hypothetical protein
MVSEAHEKGFLKYSGMPHKINRKSIPIMGLLYDEIHQKPKATTQKR